MSAYQGVIQTNVTSRTDLSNSHILTGRDALRLPRRATQVRAVYGYAWISHAGQDIVLEPGESMAFGASPDPAVITALKSANEGALVLEVLEK